MKRIAKALLNHGMHRITICTAFTNIKAAYEPKSLGSVDILTR